MNISAVIATAGLTRDGRDWKFEVPGSKFYDYEP
jgi:hypothetical protein